jgi:hypothetical protein
MCASVLIDMVERVLIQLKTPVDDGVLIQQMTDQPFSVESTAVDSTRVQLPSPVERLVEGVLIQHPFGRLVLNGGVDSTNDGPALFS